MGTNGEKKHPARPVNIIIIIIVYMRGYVTFIPFTLYNLSLSLSLSSFIFHSLHVSCIICLVCLFFVLNEEKERKKNYQKQKKNE